MMDIAHGNHTHCKNYLPYSFKYLECYCFLFLAIIKTNAFPPTLCICLLIT